VIVKLAPIAILIISVASGGVAGEFQEQSSPLSAQQQPPKQQQAPQRVRVSAGVAEKLLVKRVNPDYPKDLRKQRIQGMVALGVRISKDGDVIDVKLVSGEPALAQLAINAVKQWKYKPFLLNGQAVEVETQVLVNFTLAGI
jgi:TonB family protein